MRLKTFVRFQRLIARNIAWEPMKSADSKLTGDMEETTAKPAVTNYDGGTNETR
jgi:hypothetical protein